MSDIELYDGRKEIDFGDLTPAQINAAEYLAHNISIQRVAQLVKIPRTEITSLLQKNEQFRYVVSALQQAAHAQRKELVDQLVFLGVQKTFDILGQDYNSASESDRKEIARMARFALSLSNQEQPSTVQANIFTPQMNVTNTSVDAIARRIRQIELEDSEAELVVDYKQAAVPHAYKCHPETDFGTFNYDEETEKRQCHVCGKWESNVYSHALTMHGIEKEDYNRTFAIE